MLNGSPYLVQDPYVPLELKPRMPEPEEIDFSDFVGFYSAIKPLVWRENELRDGSQEESRGRGLKNYAKILSLPEVFSMFIFYYVLFLLRSISKHTNFDVYFFIFF